MSRRSYAQDQRRRRRACRLDVERCEERTLLSSGLGGLTAFGPPDTILLKAAADYTLTTLASFNGTNGAFPERGLVLDAHGNLFGTVPFGGANGQGAVYELAAGSRTITTLASFNGTNGDRPESDLVLDAHGNLFGTTQFGGANGQGTVFKLAAGSNTITTLASFHGTNGDQPTGSLVRNAHGNLFGATAFGGANGQGTVFKLAAGSNTITTLASFHGTNGDRPTGGLVRNAHGNLFGTTAFGGANGQGTVYELAAGSRTITTLASFNGANGAGAFPGAGLVRNAHGNLFGTTAAGGANGQGTVLELAAGSGTITTLASFNGANGAFPSAGLAVLDAQGNLFGTTEDGGVDNLGTVYELAAGSNTITTLASFNGTNGANPGAGLVLDAQGNLFGTTNVGGTGGGSNGLGTVFELSPSRGAHHNQPWRCQQPAETVLGGPDLT